MRNNKVIKEEINKFITNLNFKEIKKGDSFFITGGTGFIGRNLVWLLKEYSNRNLLNLDIIVYLRNLEKGKKLFQNDVSFLVGDIRDPINYDGKVDYYIYCAEITNSHMMKNQPVDTYETAVIGINESLKFAKTKNLKSFLYLSSIEV